MSISSLPDEAKAVIWRIFGESESPLENQSIIDLIVPVLQKHASSMTQDWVTGEIRGWFDSYGDRSWLKSDKIEPVAVMILEYIRYERGETAIWAASSINADMAVRTIRSLWSDKETDTFIERALETLGRICDQDEVLDMGRMAGLESTNAKIQKNSLEFEGRLKTYRWLDSHGFELAYQILHHGTGNLIDIVIDLRPDYFTSVIERLDHPVTQTRAAQRMISIARRQDHRESLQWIYKGSCDALIALGIVHTLDTVNRLDDDLRYIDHSDDAKYTFSTELRFPHDNLDTAAVSLLTGLVDRLDELDPKATMRWAGELLSDAPYILPHRGESEIPQRIQQLETTCTKLLARLVCQSWSDDLLDELCAGLCKTPRKTWTRHLVEIAWEIRVADPMRAAQIALAALQEHEQQVAEEVECNHLFLDWSDWHQRQCFTSLGIAIVLSRKELDLLEWVNEKCKTLPLSVWDAEENDEAFLTADRAVQHWFLIAFQAIPVFVELERTFNPSAVRILAEMVRAHYKFAGQYIDHYYSEALFVAEHAARSAVEYGEPSDTWLLDYARHPGVGPRILWAIIDQAQKKYAREGKVDAKYREMIVAEFTSIAYDHYRTGSQYNLEALQYWGRLWLLLDAVDAAEQTAIAIISFCTNFRERANKIMALKLLAMIANKKKLTARMAEHTRSLYIQLWNNYTPDEERADHKEIDEQLKRHGFSVF